MHKFKITARLGYVKILTAPDARTAVELTWPDWAAALTINGNVIKYGRRQLGTIKQL